MGRKTFTYTNDAAGAAQDFASKQRNLGEAGLGGVVFGCTNETFQECVQGLIFGLPRCHFVYVQHVRPGMPLFLYNYSDKTMHGIFRAVGYGDLDINPVGWTGGNGKTRYPAQVQVGVEGKTVKLAEGKWKPILNENFYSGSHFAFELTHAQASSLSGLCKQAGGGQTGREQPLSQGGRLSLVFPQQPGGASISSGSGSGNVRAASQAAPLSAAADAWPALGGSSSSSSMSSAAPQPSKPQQQQPPKQQKPQPQPQGPGKQEQKAAPKEEPQKKAVQTLPRGELEALQRMRELQEAKEEEKAVKEEKEEAPKKKEKEPEALQRMRELQKAKEDEKLREQQEAARKKEEASKKKKEKEEKELQRMRELQKAKEEEEKLRAQEEAEKKRKEEEERASKKEMELEVLRRMQKAKEEEEKLREQEEAEKQKREEEEQRASKAKEEERMRQEQEAAAVMEQRQKEKAAQEEEQQQQKGAAVAEEVVEEEDDSEEDKFLSQTRSEEEETVAGGAAGKEAQEQPPKEPPVQAVAVTVDCADLPVPIPTAPRATASPFIPYATSKATEQRKTKAQAPVGVPKAPPKSLLDMADEEEEDDEASHEHQRQQQGEGFAGGASAPREAALENQQQQEEEDAAAMTQALSGLLVRDAAPAPAPAPAAQHQLPSEPPQMPVPSAWLQQHRQSQQQPLQAPTGASSAGPPSPDGVVPPGFPSTSAAASAAAQHGAPQVPSPPQQPLPSPHQPPLASSAPQQQPRQKPAFPPGFPAAPHQGALRPPPGFPASVAQVEEALLRGASHQPQAAAAAAGSLHHQQHLYRDNGAYEQQGDGPGEAAGLRELLAEAVQGLREAQAPLRLLGEMHAEQKSLRAEVVALRGQVSALTSLLTQQGCPSDARPHTWPGGEHQ